MRFPAPTHSPTVGGCLDFAESGQVAKAQRVNVLQRQRGGQSAHAVIKSPTAAVSGKNEADGSQRGMNVQVAAGPLPRLPAATGRQASPFKPPPHLEEAVLAGWGLPKLDARPGVAVDGLWRHGARQQQAGVGPEGRRAAPAAAASELQPRASRPGQALSLPCADRPQSARPPRAPPLPPPAPLLFDRLAQH